MTRWRVKIVTRPSNGGVTSDELDALGDEGWELVQLVPVRTERDYGETAVTEWSWVFKRPLEDGYRR